jgi:hypothetical protein
LDNFVTARDDHGSASRAALASLDWNETCGRAVMDFVFMTKCNRFALREDASDSVRPLSRYSDKHLTLHKLSRPTSRRIVVRGGAKRRYRG